MHHENGNIGDFGMDTASLAGPLEARLQAVREAGFNQVMLSACDLAGHPQGWQAAVLAVQASGLKVTAFQGLGDFEGLPAPFHAYKIDIAKAMLEMCAALSCRLLLVGSSTSEQAAPGSDALARDLRKLAMLAIPVNIRIAYKALSWGRTVSDFLQAWDLVCQADMPNLGLGLDAFHLLASGTPLDDLELLDAQKLFLVQLSDVMAPDIELVDERRALARDGQVFPGEGAHSPVLAALVGQLHALGYRGDYSLAACHSDYRQLPQEIVTTRAWRAAQWLGEDVLRRSVPLPNQMRLRR